MLCRYSTFMRRKTDKIISFQLQTTIQKLKFEWISFELYFCANNLNSNKIELIQ